MNGDFARFRRSCPFSAGVLTTAAGLELVLVVGAVPNALRFAGAAAPWSWLLGGVLVVAGATLLLDPARRHFAGVAALVAGLLSLVGANLGGFLVGFLLAASGGALALAWVPDRGTGPAESPAEGTG
ncbi:DUF6114 domain-containing protein [Saccharothrix luteola]|uniref:DUF6114 domain-containing protein n=1 Tax=Saccharothrix luteola TaxID=2893018 RepID=UPI001E36B898|nr:DUF6114 domain-containing protein [Saccharothrix luteola]MCC8246309.1 DUF6114 domain-containing protein [Saccharothrix luteola]